MLRFRIVWFLGCQSTILAQNSSHRVHQRVGSLATEVSEVVQVKGPDHPSPQSHLFDIVALLLNHGGVIEANPLVSFVSVRTHPRRSDVVLHHGVSLLDQSADLVVREEALGPGGHALVASAPGGSVQLVVLHLVEGEGLAIQRHPHHQLLPGGPGLDPIVHGEVLNTTIVMMS